jgi:hypothetical protein
LVIIHQFVLETGSIVLLTIELMQLFSENKSDFSEFAKILGKFFHIYDDYANLYSIDEVRTPRHN